MNKISKGINLIKKMGIKKFLRSLNIYLFGDFFNYQRWQIKRKFYKPSFFTSHKTVHIFIINELNSSIIKTFKSLKKQTYENIKISIISSEIIDIQNIKEDYCIFLKNGTTLQKDCIASMIANVNDSSAIYSDHDLSGVIKTKPIFKPDFSIDLLRSYNYINQSIMFKTSDLIAYHHDNVEDYMYDNLLHLFENNKKIEHISDVLFHIKENAPLPSLYLLENHYNRLNLKVEISKYQEYFYNKYIPDGEGVSIIIPNKDHKEDLELCINSIINTTKYLNYEIIVVENNSETSEIFEYYETLKDNDKIKVIYWDDEFNYSAINNFGIKHASYEYYLFLNNDVEIKQDDWLEKMLGCIQRKEVGIVGVKLLYPNHTVQHCGTVYGIWDIASHVFLDQKEDYVGYMKRTHVQQNLSVVTAACMMTKKEVFDKVGGFDQTLKVAFNDVDYCLKTRKENYLVCLDPSIVHIHYESKSRGSDTINKEKQERFNNEVRVMKEKWGELILNGDPFYNKNLTLDRTDFTVR